MPSHLQHPHITSEFAREAERLLAANDVEGALALCLGGIAMYPEYATGYLVAAMIYVQAGKPDAARSMAQLGLLHTPNSSALKALSMAAPIAVAGETESSDVRETAELAQLARSLEGARLGKIDDNIPIPKQEPQRAELVVTPTLAKIYEQQGLIAEAIAAYRALEELGGKDREKYEALRRNLEFKM